MGMLRIDPSYTEKSQQFPPALVYGQWFGLS